MSDHTKKTADLTEAAAAAVLPHLDSRGPAPAAAEEEVPWTAKEVGNYLLTAPDSQLDASMFPKIQAWGEVPTPLQILEVLDFCVHGSLASGFVVTLLEILFREACEREGVTKDSVYAQATWRGVWP